MERCHGKGTALLANQRLLEEQCVRDMEKFISQSRSHNPPSPSEKVDVFKRITELELKLYK
jgi:hypothetical protein